LTILLHVDIIDFYKKISINNNINAFQVVSAIINEYESKID